MQLSKFPRWIPQSVGLAALVLAGCKKEPPPPPAEPQAVVMASPCPDGRSDDPPRAKLMEAQRLFRARSYSEARILLDQLLQEKPNSATTWALRGDVTLFDGDLAYEEAARQARTYYDQARALLGQGCRVQRRAEYYLHMGEAFAALRLAPREGEAYDSGELDRAEEALQLAEKRWPQSAEVHYNQARVHCARPGQLDACVERFERTLQTAESLDRPRFLRTHRSTEDWVVRSETQSEFGPLRADPRYRAAIEKARAKKSQGESERGPSHRLRLRPDSRPPVRPGPARP